MTFETAPPFSEMTLCDIHFHRFAEHKAAGYPTLVSDGDHSGYVCKGSEPPSRDGHAHGESHDGCAGILAGDTVEVHWVFTTCDVPPGPGLGSCVTGDGCEDPLLRVEARVFHLTDEGGLNFADFASTTEVHLPDTEGAVQFLGSTTGPSYNKKDACSPFQVTWHVDPGCRALNKASLDGWCGDNVFEEDHAHGVRNLVVDPKLLSEIP
ncbi:MAG: delta-class carbonic anhydrase [Acidobacteriota bacterium]